MTGAVDSGKRGAGASWQCPGRGGRRMRLQM